MNRFVGISAAAKALGVGLAICQARNVEVVILNRGEDTTFEQDLAKDVLEINTVFSARLDGSRSPKNAKLIGL